MSNQSIPQSVARIAELFANVRVRISQSPSLTALNNHRSFAMGVIECAIQAGAITLDASVDHAIIMRDLADRREAELLAAGIVN